MGFVQAGQWGPHPVLNADGQALPAATFEVFEEDGVTAATLYTDETKGTVQSQPVNVDGLGNATFFADPGRYVIKFTVGGSTTSFDVPAWVDPADVISETDANAAYERLTTFNIEHADYGADPSAADNTAAIQAAIDAANAAGGGRVVGDPSAVYTCLSTITPKSNVEIVDITIQVGASITTAVRTAVGATDVTLRRVTLDANGNVSSYLLEVSTDAERFLADQCTFKDVPSATASQVEHRDGVNDSTFHKCLFDGLTQVRVNRTARNVTFDECRWRDWWNRAVYVLSSATTAPRGVKILGGYIYPPEATSTGPRQPVTFEGQADQRIRDVLIKGLSVEGTGTAYHGAATANGATADQISLHEVDGFAIIGCISHGGGDVGITISVGTRNGIAAGNVCYNCDTFGIVVGSSSSSAQRVALIGNLCYDNGKDIDDQYLADLGQYNIRGAATSDITFVGNIGHTGDHGLIVQDNRVITGGFNDMSGATTPYLIESGSVLDGLVDGRLRVQGQGDITTAIIQAVAGQTANLLQAQASDGTVVFGVNISGAVFIDALAAAGTLALRYTIAGEANARFKMIANGRMEWGAGSVAPDVNLYRGGVDRLKTDDKFLAVAGIGVGNSAAASTLGSVTKKFDIFDEAGTKIGEVPIYDAIT